MKIQKSDIDRLKSFLGEYLEQTHKHPTAPGKEKRNWNCPCGSSDGLRYYKATNSWNCFSCKESGDIFNLYALDNGLSSKTDFEQIGTELAKMFGVALQAEPTDQGQNKPRSKEEQEKDYSVFTTAAAKELLEGQTACAARAREYLQARAISRDIAEEYGLGVAVMHGKECLVIPSNDRKTYNARIMNPDPNGHKYERPAGSSSKALECLIAEDPGPLWFVEGEFNALSLRQAGASAVAIGGASNTKLAVEFAKQHSKQFSSFVLAFDNDRAGHKAAAEVQKALDKFGLNAFSYPRENGDQRDINDIAREAEFDGSSELATMVANARRWKGLSGAAIAKLQQADGTKSFDRALELITSGAYSTIYATPFTNLNKALPGGGFHPGLMVLGSTTGAGKTTFVLQLASHFAEHGQRVLYISLEMAAVELYTRILSRRLAERKQQPLTALQLRQNSELLTLDSVTRERDFIRQYIAPNLNICEGVGDFSAAEITELATYYAAQDGKAPVVVIDYLQLLAPADPRQTDKQATDANIRTIKRLARDLNAPVFAISSYNRENYAAQDGPTLKAFKESGAIEYTADIVLALATPEEELQKGVEQRAVKLHCLKNRDGKRFELGFSYRPAVNLFEETDLEEATQTELPPRRKF